MPRPAYLFCVQDYVNLRQTPNGKIIGRVNFNTRVVVSDEKDKGWIRLESPAGWVSESVIALVYDPDPPAEGTRLADGYDCPVGTEAERRSDKVWCGNWYDASPFGRLYFVGQPNEAYHTGADLNLPGNADKGMLIYSAASGVVTTARSFPTWGNIIVIRHDPIVRPPYPPYTLYGRYAHMEKMLVRPGERVERGTPIGIVGDAFGRYSHHLHFDLSPTNILATTPHHWPGKRKIELQHYIDPRWWISTHRPQHER